jgi:hypothetical protein
MITFTSEIKWADINRCHSEYDEELPELKLGKLAVHEDIFEGGSKFRARISRYLDKRLMEEDAVYFNAKSSGLAMQSSKSTFERRMKISRYTPVVAGKLEMLNSATLQSQPRITEMPSSAGATGEGGAEQALAGEVTPSYWHKLNDNANGAGADLTEIAQDLVRNFMIHGRAYLMLKFPQTTYAETLAQQSEVGAMDATMHSISPKIIDDWLIKEGVLQYIRTHTTEDIRVNPWDESTGTRHTWTYYTPTETAAYEADEMLGAPQPQAAVLRDVTPHDLGVVSVIPMRLPSSLWLMERLREPALSLFNRRAASTWSLNQMAFSILTLIGTDPDQKVEKYIDPETEALCLNTGTAAFLAPSPAVWDALQKDAEGLEKAMDDAIQVAALSVASRDSSGRQSGVAKFREFGSLANLLSAYGIALRNTFERAVEIIKSARNETKSIKIEGLDKFDIQSLDLRTKQAKDVLPLSTSKTFDKWLVGDLLLAHAKDAPASVRAQIIADVVSAEPPEIETVGEQDQPQATGGEEDVDTDPGRDGKGKAVEGTYKERSV